MKRSLMAFMEGKLQKAIDDAEQMLSVYAHAGRGVPKAVVQRATQLRATLDATKGRS